MSKTVASYVPADFPSYQHLLTFVIHSLNIRYHCTLERLAAYANITRARLEEARKVRTDRKQLELTRTEHVSLACACFQLEAPELGLAMLRYGVQDWVTVTEHAYDREEIREKLGNIRNELQDIGERI